MSLFTGTAKELVFQLARVEDDRVYDVVEHKEKRSLNSNSYYWTLLTKVADKLRISKSRLHNDMIRHYGQRMTVDDKPVIVYIPDTEESENTAMESDTVHLKQTSKVLCGNDGITYRAWVMMRGSSTYDSSEMAILISGIVQEAKQLGIETLTPAEIAQMMELERQAEAKRYEKQTNESNRHS